MSDDRTSPSTVGSVGSEVKHPEPAWRKTSSRATGAYVDVAEHDGMIMLRDPKQSLGNVLSCTPKQWQSFIRKIKAGKFDDLAKSKPRTPTRATRPERAKVAHSVREETPPVNWLDLLDRILSRATSSWGTCLMHVALIAVTFAGLGTVAHAATGVSPWVAAGGSLGGGIVAGVTAYTRRRANKQVKGDGT